MNSLNGTYLNDKRLSPGSENKLSSNDVIVFGKESSKFTFFYEVIDSPINLAKERETKGFIKNFENNKIISIGPNNNIRNVTAREPSNSQNNIANLNEIELDRLRQKNLDLEEKVMKIENNMEIIKKENILLMEEIEKVKKFIIPLIYLTSSFFMLIFFYY